jgi:hypothetical protein
VPTSAPRSSSDIKCRKAGLKPDAAVIVATVRAIKYHGGVEVADLGKENLKALQAGIANLDRHIDNVRDVFGLPCLVAINHRAEDSEAELRWLIERTTHHGVKVIVAKHYSEGSKGAVDVAKEVVELCNHANYFKFVYDEKDTLWDKMKAVATKIYGASEITADSKVRAQIKQLQEGGYGLYPICVAKTQYSFSTDPKLRGAPHGHVVNYPRGAACGRRGVRRDDLRRHHDDAGPAGDSGGEQHRRHRRREDYRAFLGPITRSTHSSQMSAASFGWKLRGSRHQSSQSPSSNALRPITVKRRSGRGWPRSRASSPSNRPSRSP